MTNLRKLGLAILLTGFLVGTGIFIDDHTNPDNIYWQRTEVTSEKVINERLNAFADVPCDFSFRRDSRPNVVRLSQTWKYLRNKSVFDLLPLSCARRVSA